MYIFSIETYFSISINLFLVQFCILIIPLNPLLSNHLPPTTHISLAATLGLPDHKTRFSAARRGNLISKRNQLRPKLTTSQTLSPCRLSQLGVNSVDFGG